MLPEQGQKNTECQHRSKTWNKYLHEVFICVCVCVFEDIRVWRQLEKSTVNTLTLFPGWVFVHCVCVHGHPSSIFQYQSLVCSIILVSLVFIGSLLTCDVTAEFHSKQEEIKSFPVEIGLYCLNVRPIKMFMEANKHTKHTVSQHRSILI